MERGSKGYRGNRVYRGNRGRGGKLKELVLAISKRLKK